PRTMPPPSHTSSKYADQQPTQAHRTASTAPCERHAGPSADGPSSQQEYPAEPAPYTPSADTHPNRTAPDETPSTGYAQSTRGRNGSCPDSTPSVTVIQAVIRRAIVSRGHAQRR